MAEFMHPASAKIKRTLKPVDCRTPLAIESLVLLFFCKGPAISKEDDEDFFIVNGARSI